MVARLSNVVREAVSPSLGALCALGVACVLLSPGAARADALDDTLANFLADKFSQSEKAVNELAAEAPRTRRPFWRRSATIGS